MKARDRALAIKQLDGRLDALRHSDSLQRPPRGWIRAIRQALGMTTAQLAERTGVSQPRIVEMERAEKTGAITLDTLERVARAMHCRLEYVFLPEQPLQELVEERAQKLANKRIATIGHHMALEAQAVTTKDEAAHIETLTQEIAEHAGSDIWKESEK
ncbi:MAG: mobile mystery protein A [Gammaproteobacteria bacterium]